MREFRKNLKGRGATGQTPNRFEATRYEPEAQEWDGYWWDEGPPLVRTQFLPDASRSIVTENKSPDIGFRYSLNPYRGCEHGCAYCYARPTHEYLGYSAGVDFESRILVKEKAPELLTEHLMSPRWKPEPIFMSGITDCYQPVERKLELTRRCLEVFLRFRHPVGLITKNALIVRDRDLLAPLAELGATVVFISVTSLDGDLASALEPRTSRPEARLRAIRELSSAGIPVGVNVAPVIPGLTDHELPRILEAAREAGARFAGYTPLRLPLAVLPLFEDWLAVNRPERREKVLSLIRDIRGGKMNDARFGSRMRGEGPMADTLQKMFRLTCRRVGFNREPLELSTKHFQRPGDQLALF